MRAVRIVILTGFISLCIVFVLYAAGDKAPAKAMAKQGASVPAKAGKEALAVAGNVKKGANVPAKEGKRQLTKEELAKHIKDLLDNRDDVLSAVREIKKETDPDGKVSYLYGGAKLEDMNRDDLQKLLNKINGEMGRINSERLQKQLEVIRQADQASRSAQQGSRQVNIPRLPPQPPAVYMPPMLPPAPPNVIQPPKTPTPPPTPPRR